MNYHGLADFRVGHGELLDRLLSESVAAMLAEGLIDLDDVIIDGTKVKASASKDSFARENRVARAERLASERIARLKAELNADPGASTRRRQAASERAARDIAMRAGKARDALERPQDAEPPRGGTRQRARAAQGMAQPDGLAGSAGLLQSPAADRARQRPHEEPRPRSPQSARLGQGQDCRPLACARAQHSRNKPIEARSCLRPRTSAPTTAPLHHQSLSTTRHPQGRIHPQDRFLHRLFRRRG